jgi:hypothetical protein
VEALNNRLMEKLNEIGAKLPMENRGHGR